MISHTFKVIFLLVLSMFFYTPLYASPLKSEINRSTCTCIENITGVTSCSELISKEILTGKFQFTFKNGSIFNPYLLQMLASHYLDKSPDIYGVSEARNAITKLYICEGYINSGALLDNYNKETQSVTFEIVNGSLDLDDSKIEIIKKDKTKSDYLADKFIKRYLKRDNNVAFNSKKLRTRLEFLRRKSQLHAVNATIMPSPDKQLGKAILDITATEAPRYSGNVTLNNSRNPSIGSLNLTLSGRYNSLFTNDSYLYYSLGLSEGAKDFSVGYSLDTSHPDITWNLELGKLTSVIIDSTFDSLDIESESKYITATSKYHFKQKYDADKNSKTKKLNTTSEEWSLVNGLKVIDTQNTLLGRPFSFSSGEVEGKSTLAKTFIGLERVKQDRNQAQYLYAGLDIGLDAFGSSINNNAPDSKYTALVGQYSYQKKLSTPEHPIDGNLMFHINGQYTQDDLLSSSQLSLGGFNNVRGYRQGTASVDKGLTTSLEMNIPVGNRATFTDKQPGDGRISIIPFIDYGIGKDNDSESKFTVLLSIGVGTSWYPGKHIKAELYLSKALTSKDLSDGNDHDLQDEGVHFQITAPLPW